MVPVGPEIVDGRFSGCYGNHTHNSTSSTNRLIVLVVLILPLVVMAIMVIMVIITVIWPRWGRGIHGCSSKVGVPSSHHSASRRQSVGLQPETLN